MKRLIAAATFLLVAASFACYLYFSGRAEFLVLERGRSIKVNGVPVPGEVLGRRGTDIVTRRGGTAIVTRRDAGKEHSYELFPAGDTDMTGDAGSVGDCHPWVAPHLPFIVVIHPCTGTGAGRLMGNGGLHFTTADKSIIQLN
jgi:hypothetical protein